MSVDLDFTYFDSLCEEDQAVQHNYKQLQEVLEILKKLAKPDVSEATRLLDLQKLVEAHERLISSSVDLRYAKYKTRERLISNNRRIRGSENHSKLQNVQGLRRYITLIEHVNKESLDYVNLLQRLSADLARQIEISDPDTSEFIVDNWTPPSYMQSILEQLADPSKDSTRLQLQLTDHLDQIKMERAKYTIENKHSLQETLNKINKEVNYWRRNWNAIENLMFGDSAHSIRRMFQSIDLLKTKLDEESGQENGMGTNVDAVSRQEK